MKNGFKKEIKYVFLIGVVLFLVVYCVYYVKDKIICILQADEYIEAEGRVIGYTYMEEKLGTAKNLKVEFTQNGNVMYGHTSCGINENIGDSIRIWVNKNNFSVLRRKDLWFNTNNIFNGITLLLAMLVVVATGIFMKKGVPDSYGTYKNSVLVQVNSQNVIDRLNINRVKKQFKYNAILVNDNMIKINFIRYIGWDIRTMQDVYYNSPSYTFTFEEDNKVVVEYINDSKSCQLPPWILNKFMYKYMGIGKKVRLV